MDLLVHILIYFWWYLLKALLLTLILEAPVIWLGVGNRIHPGDKRRFIVNFVLINAITNIALNLFIFVFSTFLIGNIIIWGTITIVMELIIPFVEAKMYRYATEEFSMKRLLVTCYIANMVSFLIGGWLLSIWR